MAHRLGVVARDVKPSNWFLVGAKLRVKVFDFGVARPGAPAAPVTRTGAVLGSPGDKAPEQV